MVAAPLVMPEVIIGLSLLLMLVSLQRATEAMFGVGFPERGMLTIWLGHLLLGLAYATVVVQARLQTLNPQLEEAALDLGARPWQVFWLVTLPMIGQALLSAFLLTFTLSLDDVVLSAFLSGPGATTMPLVIFSRARLGLNPSVNAVATIIIGVVAIGVVVASFVIARNERRRAARAAAANRARAMSESPTSARGSPTCALAAAMAIVGAYVGFSKALVIVFPVFVLAGCASHRRGRDGALAAPARERSAARPANPIGCCSSNRSSATSCSRSACCSASRAARRSPPA